MEKRAKYAKIHPEMSNLDLTKILSKKYKELPDKKKVWTGTRTWTTISDVTFCQQNCLYFSCSKSTSVSSSRRRKTSRRTWLASSE